ncbi:MAG: hypothetical protein GXO63_03195 [Candidatus Micrarchaeota archaeon]|nr:hypothetical protein [Candidatus Micrarchaeota archaeon]
MVDPVLIFLGFAALVLFIVLAGIVIFANPGSWGNRSLFAYFIAKSVMVYTTVMIPLVFDYVSAEMLFRVMAISIIFFSTYLFLFSSSFYLDRKKMLGYFALLTAWAFGVSVILFFTDFYYVLSPAPYGWFYDFNIFGYVMVVGYYLIVEGTAIYLIWNFLSRIQEPTIKSYMKRIFIPFVFHFFLAGLVVGQRVLFSTAQYDLLWPVIDVFLFGMALYYFLKLRAIK